MAEIIGKLALGRKYVEMKKADPEPFPNQFTTQAIREKGNWQMRKQTTFFVPFYRT